MHAGFTVRPVAAYGPMGDAPEQTSIDYETYLILEAKADQKHEWLDGQIYAMAGGTIEHSQLTTQMIMELGRLASACGCRVFNSDLKIRVQATGLVRELVAAPPRAVRR